MSDSDRQPPSDPKPAAAPSPTGPGERPRPPLIDRPDLLVDLERGLDTVKPSPRRTKHDSATATSENDRSRRR